MVPAEVTLVREFPLLSYVEVTPGYDVSSLEVLWA